jgi:peptidoglycan/LPS O-acetylase OafA/YrhL
VRQVRVAPRRRGARSKNIPALDGIRAVAVGLVLAEHGGIPGVSGGFLGVDVFFVLSGFLITSLLVDELGRSGRIAMADFWIRRARRLLPALIAMVLAVVAAHSLFSSEATATLRNDAVAAFFWMANWAFVAQNTDYFSQGSPPSPLQHTWSLGVEEQYYLLWPLLVLAVAALIGARARWAVFALAALGVVGSATAAILMAPDVNRVYFGTDTRVQALLVGAAAAALLVRDWSVLTAGGTLIGTRWRRWVACGLSIVGLAALGVLTHYATGSAREFRLGLLIAVALAAVLVVAPVALDPGSPVARALGWPPLVGLGAISYGVYLWHWPIFLALNGERTGWSGWSLFALRCAATIAVATASWWLLEQPVRRWRPVIVPMLPLAGATAATAAAVTMLVLPVSAKPNDGPLGPGVDSAALVSPEVPVEVKSPPGQLAPGTKRVAVFGDSVAWTMMRYLPPTPGLSFTNYTTIGCGIARGGPYRYAGETLPQKLECDDWPSRWSQRINHDLPDTVLLIIGRWEVVDRLSAGHWTHIGDDAYDAYLRDELQRALGILTSTGARVIVTTEPYNRRGERSDGSLYPEDQPSRADRWNTLVRSVIGKRPDVTVLDLNKKLCPDGYYTNKVDGIKMRIDGVHPTPEAVKWLTPWLSDALKGTAK